VPGCEAKQVAIAARVRARGLAGDNRAGRRCHDCDDVFVVGNNGVVYSEWWTEGQPWSGMQDDWRPLGGFFPVGV
jgi:hypothetical protein